MLLTLIGYVPGFEGEGGGLATKKFLGPYVYVCTDEQLMLKYFKFYKPAICCAHNVSEIVS